MTEYVHSNQNYRIFVSHVPKEFAGQQYDTCYAVCNSSTEVVEYYAHTLPDAIHQSEHLNHSLVNKTWEWIGKPAALGDNKAASLN